MAKKKTPGLTPSNDSAAQARRRTTTRRAAAIAPTAPAGGSPLSDLVPVTAAAPVSTAAEMSALISVTDASHGPSSDEIAVAAYLRYLQRGGQDGRDFDDWIEAENDLKRLYIR